MNWAIIMKQIVFKREFFILFDAVKIEKGQYLEEKIQPIKKTVIEKILKKSRLKFEFQEIQIFEKISSNCSYSMSIPGISLYQI